MQPEPLYAHFGFSDPIVELTQRSKAACVIYQSEDCRRVAVESPAMEIATPPISRLHLLLLGLLLASLSVHYYTVLCRTSSSPPDFLPGLPSRSTECDSTVSRRGRSPLDSLGSVPRSILSSCITSVCSVFDRAVGSRVHPDPSGLSCVSLLDGWSGPEVRCYSQAGPANFDMGPVEGLVILVEVDSGRMVRVSGRGEGWYIESTHVEYGLEMAADRVLLVRDERKPVSRTGTECVIESEDLDVTLRIAESTLVN